MRRFTLLMPVLVPALTIAVAIGACGPSNVAVSSTTTAHKARDIAPPPPDTSTKVVLGNDPVPPATDATERVIYTRAGSIWMMMPDGKEPHRITVRATAP